MTKKMFLTAVAVSIVSGGLVVATNAFAATSNSGQNGVPSLVQEIANKFHLNQSDVQSVFDKHRQEVQSKMEANYETYLQNLVNSGKITEEQKQLILNKHKELESQMENEKNNFKNMTPAQRRSQMQTTRQNLENWAKQNNIDLQYLRPFGHERGFGRGGWHHSADVGQSPSASTGSKPTPSQ